MTIPTTPKPTRHLVPTPTREEVRRHRASRRPGSPSPFTGRPARSTPAASWCPTRRHRARRSPPERSSPRCRSGTTRPPPTPTRRRSAPARSANSRGSTIPACARTPPPPTSTDRPCDHPDVAFTPPLRLLVFFTLRVLLPGVLPILTISIFPGQEHFLRSDTHQTRDHRPAMNTPG
jgi:hypothetical protein